MQGKKKICAIFATVILFLSGFIYVTRFDVREGLCAEAGTDMKPNTVIIPENIIKYVSAKEWRKKCT